MNCDVLYPRIADQPKLGWTYEQLVYAMLPPTQLYHLVARFTLSQTPMQTRNAVIPYEQLAQLGLI
jgi:hypothetical protein